MFVVDTNILVYAAETTFPEHVRARAILEEWRRGPDAWFLTWSVIYELLRVTTHPRVFARPWSITDAWTFVLSLRASPSLRILSETERHASVAEGVWRQVPDVRGNLVHDAHTAILMKEHGIRRIMTRDRDFHRFPFIEVIDPLAVA